MAVTNRDLLRDFTVQIKAAVSKDSCDILSKAVEKAPGSDDAKSMWLDQAFREFLTGEIMRVQTTSSDMDKFDKYIELSIQAAQRNLCSKVTPITLLSDMCDIITLDQCETLFATIERNIQLWKSEEFFTPIRNNLLRICNDLLRRLSRSQNTVFCGRILLFLAKFFPFSERSGLNVVSEFNLENTTVFSSAEEAAEFKNGSNGDKEDKDGDEAMEVEDGIKIEADQRSLSVDYALYSKFWKLQDFFRNPNQCYTNVNWRTFSTYSTDVLKTFKSFKVDVISGKAASGGEQFFAKYLTNQNLLQLQLSDSNFRRYVLVQFLILFQYLKSSVKFKSEAQVLTDEQSRWIEKTEKVIHELINETPPDGNKFSLAVKHILHRETQWNIWKNQGCKPLTPKEDPKVPSLPGTSPSKSLIKTGTTRKRKAKLGDQIQQAVKQGKFLMGNQVLTKLWNQYPDNMDACSAPERDFLPSMEEYFAEAIEQLDPSNQIEEEYKIVKDGQWGWRALRLLAKKSPYFFTYGNNPIARLPDYLDSMLKKMSNFTPSTNASTNGTKEAGKTETSADLCTKENLSKIASNLGDEWTKLIPKLGLSQEDAEKFTKDGKTSQERGELMLTKWLEMEKDGATKEEITYILEGLKMSKALEGVFNNS